MSLLAQVAPPASFTRPHARRPPFSMGMIACPSLVARLLAQREGDVALAPATLIAAMAACVAISSVDVRRERPPLLDGPKRAQRTGGVTPHHGADVAPQMADPVRCRLKGWGRRPSSFLGRPSGTPYFFRKYGARVHTAFSYWRFLSASSSLPSAATMQAGFRPGVYALKSQKLEARARSRYTQPRRRW
jgi:hypothetical protein